MDLIAWFEYDFDNFEALDKEEFDKLHKAGEFETGPLLENHGKWIQQYGPYNPNKWAFGMLKGDRYVKCDVNKHN